MFARHSKDKSWDYHSANHTWNRTLVKQLVSKHSGTARTVKHQPYILMNWNRLKKRWQRSSTSTPWRRLTCGVVTLKVVPVVGVAGRGEMLFWAWAWAWAWAKACWGTITNWPNSVRTRTIPEEEQGQVLHGYPNVQIFGSVWNYSPMVKKTKQKNVLSTCKISYVCFYFPVSQKQRKLDIFSSLPIHMPLG